MRIISGWARGRRLAAPPGRGQDIRPTSDRAREALFSILSQSVIDSRVLDLFAGTGALGLEALSRGAKELVSVDFLPKSLQLIKKNIDLLQPAKAGCTLQLIRHDLRRGLPPELLENDDSRHFDLIFLDPPYSQELSLKTLQNLSNGQLLHEHSIVVAEDRATASLPANCGVLELSDTRTYGDTAFWLYTVNTNHASQLKDL